ncbi:MAG: hypothetical protein IJ744_06695 [Lachnospiraceae bacterium]|nr:hypothetical protein [Lachnospiraceae bacterium]
MIKQLKEQIMRLLPELISLKKLPEDQYTHMKYPKLIPLMHFGVEQYELDGFGHLFMMHTTTKMGMELFTLSFMPTTCVKLPYLLIDAMSMKKKQCVFVEYYGCDMESLFDERLKEVYEIYQHLPDYQEKENWYIKEREPYSLIKTGEHTELIEMAVASVKAYLSSVEDAEVDLAYKEKLETFRERMIVEGNPSSKTLSMLLGEEGAVEFMKNAIMPLT